MKELIMVTGNKKKLKEAQLVLKGFRLESHEVDIVEIQGTPEEIVSFKAKEAFRILKKPCFVEDVAFGFEAWNWMPGPYIKDFLKYVGVENLPGLLEGKSKKARAVCTIGYAASADDVLIVKGEVYGTIVSYSDDNGFGFDMIFIPEGHDKRFSQMPMEEKNKISHRGRALEKLKEILKDDS